MTLRQKTIIRVAVGGLLLVGLIYREVRNGYSPHTIALLFGIVFLIAGIISIVAKRYTLTGRFAPNLEEQLTPIWGYGPPKRWLPIIIALDFLVGIALIAWAVL
jgi:hypothetical protein